MDIIETFGPDGVPAECALPTAEQPLRIAEFQDLFASVTCVERFSPNRLHVVLAGEAGIADRARDLAARETSCCSFFAFDVVEQGPSDDHAATTMMTVDVGPAHVGVLDGVERLARTSVVREST